MKILIVEDEAGIATFLQEGLAEEGYMVDVAANGEAGLEMAFAKEYSVILLDWMLPGIDGLEVCRKFRAKGHTTPVIFLTVRDDATDIATARAAGANDYLKKPVAFEELLVHVKAQISPGAREDVAPRRGRGPVGPSPGPSPTRHEGEIV